MNTAPRILRIKQVTDIIGVSRASVYAWVAKGEFPKQVKLGLRASGWRSDEVEAWIASRV